MLRAPTSEGLPRAASINVTLRILTGIEEAYVELGATEPITQDPAGILE